MSKYDGGDQPDWCWLQVQPSGDRVKLPVHRLKKTVQCTYGKSDEYVELGGDRYLLPDGWPHLCHVWEICSDCGSAARDASDD